MLGIEARNWFTVDIEEFIRGFQVFDKEGNGFIGAGELCLTHCCANDSPASSVGLCCVDLDGRLGSVSADIGL